MDSAEQAALSHKFDPALSSKYSQRYNGQNGKNSDGSRNVFVKSDNHFDQLPINVNFSSVFLSPGVKETESEVQNGIRWSEYLDLLFVNNYEMDPSLSWQYFGSSTGFFRKYPAIKWPPANGVPEKFHDFRTSSWYIDAATSSKDIVILLDSSSSMGGKKREIARAIVNSILDTLGNNDFVNIYRFTEATNEIVPCFKDILVQATAENVRELRIALDYVKQEGSANLTLALVTAFEILHKYNRTGQGCQCNQAIMLITDGPSSTYKDIFKQYNWPHMPVRMFTYLTGRDGSNIDEMNWMACANKGYFARVESPEDAQAKVLQYIAVLARPMVLYQHDHPVQWTPVYAGLKFYNSKAVLSEDDHLMTSVSTPIFDRRNYSEKTAKLLGVVGTDVPISQIKKLIPPYKLGVNGYSFIVDNNGHILYHPDLRPLFQEALKPNYNGVDLTQVELVDGETGTPLKNHTLLLDLRHEMIDQKEGETELSVIIHYDNMKRVMSRRHRYFYNAIDGTPFSLGIAIPEGYGMYEVLGEQEIKHSPVNVLSYFQGSNWKIHPDWIYCEYNYPFEHVFESAEEKLLHFLERTHKPGWKWMSLRPRSPIKEPGHTMKKMEKDSYYCDKNLMQSLVYDAMVTEGLDRHTMSKIKEDKQ
ncbi:hypothetical protein RUM43_003904 [Polyplax serrata]|uniref:VWFA domain-containing protein n=1 Tax=Polyplax serrata TaxID=468196 RepID=A0AAN8P7B6_POLSC